MQVTILKFIWKCTFWVKNRSLEINEILDGVSIKMVEHQKKWCRLFFYLKMDHFSRKFLNDIYKNVSLIFFFEKGPGRLNI